MESSCFSQNDKMRFILPEFRRLRPSQTTGYRFFPVDSKPSRRLICQKMRLLIDGYNLMFESTSIEQSADGRGELRAARGRLLHLLVDLIDERMRDQTMIVFDAKKAPPGLPDQYAYYGIRIVFARDWDSADELIQNEIRRHSAPKTLTVVSSDHAIHRRALARGAKVIDSDQWLDRELENRARLARQGPNSPEATADFDFESKNQELSDAEKKRWLMEFDI